MFEKASRLKLRFESTAGTLTVEDLWELPLTSKAGHANLDQIAKNLNRKLQESEESFVETPAPKNSNLQLAFEIVKYIIKYKMDERDVARIALEKREKRNKIAELISRKQDDALSNLGVEELQKMLNEL